MGLNGAAKRAGKEFHLVGGIIKGSQNPHYFEKILEEYMASSAKQKIKPQFELQIVRGKEVSVWVKLHQAAEILFSWDDEVL